MLDFINKFKIPTLLGLGLIVLGTISGVYLTLRQQTVLSQAAPNLNPQNIIFSNIIDDSVTVSWQTNSATTSFVTLSQKEGGEQTVLDDRNNYQAGKLKPRLTHYITLKNLLPKTNYQFKIISGKITSNSFRFETAQAMANQTGLPPIIGSVLDGDRPLDDGIVYLSIPDAVIQSALIKQGGNFLISLSQIRKSDLSAIYQFQEGAIAKLTIQADQGEASVLFKLKADSILLPSIKLGQHLDLTIPQQSQPPESASDWHKYDLNGDGKINAADNAIILKNFGKNPKNTKADLNEDGVVNQNDLDLMAQKLNQLGPQ